MVQQVYQAAEWKQNASCGSTVVRQYFAPPAAAADAVVATISCALAAEQQLYRRMVQHGE
jgi:hypothetical protein